MLVAEMHRRWTWTAFALWTVGGVLAIPYVIIHGVPMVGWFPFGKFIIMLATATYDRVLAALGETQPPKSSPLRDLVRGSPLDRIGSKILWKQIFATSPSTLKPTPTVPAPPTSNA